MLLCVATIAAGAISCESKAKKEAEEAAKQEALMKEEAAKQAEIARQEAKEKEDWRQKCIEQSYKEGYDWGYASAQGWHGDKLHKKIGSLDYGVTGFNKRLRDSEFGEEYPSDIPLCIEKYKKGYDDGFEEAWSFSHSN